MAQNIRPQIFSRSDNKRMQFYYQRNIFSRWILERIYYQQQSILLFSMSAPLISPLMWVTDSTALEISRPMTQCVFDFLLCSVCCAEATEINLSQ